MAMWPKALLQDSSVTGPVLTPQSLIVASLVIELHQGRWAVLKNITPRGLQTRSGHHHSVSAMLSVRCKECRRGLGWRSPASPWSLPCRDCLRPFPDTLTLQHTNTDFPGSSLGTLLPCLHLRSLPCTSSKGLTRGCLPGWGQVKSPWKPGLGPRSPSERLSRSPERAQRLLEAQPQLIDTVCHLQPSKAMPAHTREPIWRKSFSHLLFKSESKFGPRVKNLSCVFLNTPTELLLCTCTSWKSWYPDFTVLMCARSL